MHREREREGIGANGARTIFSRMKNQKKDERHWPSKAAQGSAKGECIRASYIYAIDSSNRGSHVGMDAFTRSQVSFSLSRYRVNTYVKIIVSHGTRETQPSFSLSFTGTETMSVNEKGNS